MQNQLTKLERFVNQAVGEHGTKIDHLERQVEHLLSLTQKLRHQLTKAEQERKELREEIEELHKGQALPPVPTQRPPRPAPPPVPPRRSTENKQEDDGDCSESESESD